MPQVLATQPIPGALARSKGGEPHPQPPGGSSAPADPSAADRRGKQTEKRKGDQGGQGEGKSRGREGERRGQRKGKKKEGAKSKERMTGQGEGRDETAAGRAAAAADTAQKMNISVRIIVRKLRVKRISSISLRTHH